MSETYQMDFDDIQEAFIQDIISLDQFIEILIDNFGYLKTKQILKRNLKLARKQEKQMLKNQKT